MSERINAKVNGESEICAGGVHPSAQLKRGNRFSKKLKQDFRRNKALYVMILPVLAFFIVFSYLPMGGLLMSFKDYNPIKGIFGSAWAQNPLTGETDALFHFRSFFQHPDFWMLIRNTLVFSGMDLVIVFPASILFALAMHSIKNKKYRRTAQTLVYLPYFISTVIVCGIIRDFTSANGMFGVLFQKMGLVSENQGIMTDTRFFRWIVILSNVWTGTGYGSIIYIAALSSIDPSMYEAAEIDGAGKWRTFWRITLPSIMPTIMIFLLLRIGSVLNYSFERIYLLDTSDVKSISEVLATYVYRLGFGEYPRLSYATAVGMFNSVVGFGLLIFSNALVKKFGQSNLF